jgi:hypothetical protein
MNNRTLRNTFVSSAVAAIVLGATPLSSQAAVDFLDPPSTYDYHYWYAANSVVPDVYMPTYTNGTSAIRLGTDYVFLGRPIERTWASALPSWAFGYRANDESGTLVFDAGTALKGCSSSCVITIAAAEQTCRSIQLNWGLDSKFAWPSVGDITFKYLNQTTTQACLTSTRTTATTTGYAPTTTYIQLIAGLQYRYARVRVKGTHILFTKALVDLPVTDTKMKAAHALCLSQGWDASSTQRGSINYFRDQIRYQNYNRCYVPNTTLEYFTHGPQPEEGIYAETRASRIIVNGDYVSIQFEQDIE